MGGGVTLETDIKSNMVNFEYMNNTRNYQAKINMLAQFGLIGTYLSAPALCPLEVFGW